MNVAMRAANGAAYLDNHPEFQGWRSHVDPVKLDLADACLCVLGQLGRSAGFADRYERALAVVLPPGVRDSWGQHEWASRHGFILTPIDVEEDDVTMADLTDAWRVLLTADE